MDDFDLERFVAAQTPVIGTVIAELRAGDKRTHWMWFVFPQLRGLGQSATARFYGLASLEEARAYLAHPVLGARLGACLAALEASGATSLRAVFGSPDDFKFASCMTLFARADPAPENVFARALARWCGGVPDGATLALLAEHGS